MANSLAVYYEQGHGAAPLIVESADEVDVLGNPMEFPPDSELPLDAIRAAVKEFLQTGTRPSSVTWKSWPEDLL